MALGRFWAEAEFGKRSRVSKNVGCFAAKYGRRKLKSETDRVKGQGVATVELILCHDHLIGPFFVLCGTTTVLPQHR